MSEQRAASIAPSEAMTGTVPAVADYVALLKPRVMSLVVFTALVGLLAAQGTLHPAIAAIAILCIAVAAAASGALNMWYERDVDALMARTAARPLPAGRMPAGDALGFGVVLTVGAVTMMALAANWTAAALLALTIAFYVFVYTIWLKRRTPQNIVIGGAAGAFPPMVGWAAVTGDVSLGSISLFALIFMWTPPHFWALSLYRCADYAKAGIPMMPVVAGAAETRRQILFYAVLLLPVSFGPAVFGPAGAAYVATAAVSGAVFLAMAVALWRRPSERAARRLFGYSILYLFVLFAALMAESIVTRIG